MNTNGESYQDEKECGKILGNMISHEVWEDYLEKMIEEKEEERERVIEKIKLTKEKVKLYKLKNENLKREILLFEYQLEKERNSASFLLKKKFFYYI